MRSFYVLSVLFIFQQGYSQSAVLVNKGGFFVSDKAVVSINNGDLKNHSSVKNNGSIYISGNVYTDAVGSTFDNDTLLFSKDFIGLNNSTLFGANNTLILSGNSPSVTTQNIKHTGKVANLTASGSAPKTIEGDLVVDKELKLTSGILSAKTSSDKIGISKTGDFSGGSNNSYVGGKLYRERKRTQNDLSFPVGAGGRYRLLSLISVDTVAGSPGLPWMQVENGLIVPAGASAGYGLDTLCTKTWWKVATTSNKYRGSYVMVNSSSGDLGSITNPNELVLGYHRNKKNGQFVGVGNNGGFLNPVTSEIKLDTGYIVLGHSHNLGVSVSKLFLQGPFNSGTNTMNTGLNSKLIARHNPNTGTESLKMFPSYTVPANAVDLADVVIQRTSDNARVDSSKVWVMKDGTLRDFYTGSKNIQRFAKAPANSYRIIFKGESHLPIATVGFGLTTSNTNIDFSTIANIYSGSISGMFLAKPGYYTIYSGEAKVEDPFGIGLYEVNSADWFKVAQDAEVPYTGYKVTDLNRDSFINAVDYNIIDANNIILPFSQIPK